MGATFCSSGSRGLQPSRSIKALIGTWRERGPSAPRNSRGQCSPVFEQIWCSDVATAPTKSLSHIHGCEGLHLQVHSTTLPFFRPSILPPFHSSTPSDAQSV